MNFNLNTTLEIILPQLSEQLVEPSNRLLLATLASRLPPIPRVLLECRLAPGRKRTVDLSQGYLPSDEISEQWLQMLGAGIHSVFRDWRKNDSILSDNVSSIWLEFDTGTSPVPSPFFRLSEGVTDYALILRHIMRLLNVSNSYASKLLEALPAQLPETARITYFGVMLPRNPNQIRVNIANLEHGDLKSLLQFLDWQGSWDEIATTCANIYKYVPNPVITFDITNTIPYKLGFECVPNKTDAPDEKWRSFIQYLGDKNWCDLDHIEGVRNWVGYSDPTNTEKWPLLLTLQAIANSPSLDLIIRRISHIKVTLHAPSSVETKVYLWFGRELVPLEELGFI